MVLYIHVVHIGAGVAVAATLITAGIFKNYRKSLIGAGIFMGIHVIIGGFL